MTRVVFIALGVTVGCRGPTEASAVDPDANGRESHDWDYAGADGPQHWGELPGFTKCGEGRFQSPVDLPGFALVREKPSMSYTAAPLTVVNDGHTVQIQDTGPGSLTVGGTTFALSQVHFHAPSEHAVEGDRYPMEIHMVHEDGRGNYAVLAVFVENARGGTAPELWTHLATEVGSKVRFEEIRFDPSQLVPEAAAHFQYAGSLTTPPCTERVTWEVMAEPIRLTGSQIAAFTELYRANARPLQPSHAWCLPPAEP